MRMCDSLLYRKDQVSVHQLVLPVQKRKEQITLAHDTILGGHLGAKEYLQRLKTSF